MRTLHRQRGGITVMVIVSLTTLLAIVGLVFSVGMSYMVKAKLNAATDAAGLAAARAISNGTTQTDQAANARAAAQRFFAANFPSGYMMSTATLNDVGVSFSASEVTITVSASATMPVALFGGFSSGSLAPGVLTETKRKDLDMVVVMDTSGSLSGSAVNVRSSAVTFLKQFNSDRDRVGLVHFAFGSIVDDAIRPTARGFDRTSMTNHINAFSFSGSTASPEGMYTARAQINSVPTANNNRSNLRVIVFFSDGAPNSFGSYLTFNTASDCKTAGVIYTDDDGSGTPAGLYKLDQQYDDIGGTCTPSNLPNKVSALPAYYNAHNASWDNRNDVGEYPVITSSPRVVTSALTYANVNRASRNLVEAMASKSRDEGIYVFTLGLGSALKVGTGVDNEKGEDVLKCMANSIDAPSRCYNSAKPIGVYCYAATQNDLTPCFSKLASAILRISK
ncbi:VWA domain-containing protein [Duganella sp. FT80W]|uniref:VWA domain-containing protein n=1 Tax=Duganella guangzhouensis TaxID=2666084 RepID=A0A6I2LED7_9BURK|nr:vWA domain-containing protein [Duganella guangzhouensis]MRW94619.1 VWA domain-containing protein [Duganella guangzhouensis]